MLLTSLIKIKIICYLLLTPKMIVILYYLQVFHKDHDTYSSSLCIESLIWSQLTLIMSWCFFFFNFLGFPYYLRNSICYMQQGRLWGLKWKKFTLMTNQYYFLFLGVFCWVLVDVYYLNITWRLNREAQTQLAAKMLHTWCSLYRHLLWWLILLLFIFSCWHVCLANILEINNFLFFGFCFCWKFLSCLCQNCQSLSIKTGSPCTSWCKLAVEFFLCC